MGRGREEGAGLDRPEDMSGKPQASTGAHFHVPSQFGGAINNVGRDLYVGEGRRRSATVGRVVAALGLALFFAGLFLVGAAGMAVYNHTDWSADQIDVAVPGYAVPAGALIVAGIVLNRFGRLFAGR
jgi:hypothetical protein